MPYKDLVKNKQCRSKYYKRVGYWKKIRMAVVVALGSKCKRCGFADPRALQIDHVYGGGTKERREIKNPRKLYMRYIEEADSGKYQLLCANCNWIKRDENNENRI